MSYVCAGPCGRTLEPSTALQGRQRRAVAVCEPCVRASIDPDELRRLLNPPAIPLDSDPRNP